eukprot:GFUD01031472.1.p1 GENE.GFUD01031472.1~~GFUD01031472.1.p1  ORF type:complete len:938 (+),score=300.01 GFUD01031472.1:38-2851(+)
MSDHPVSLGSRCVRGPDWQWGDQDGGPGNVGTVVILGRAQHPECPPGTVKVVWDNGTSQNYRVGHGGQYDLRLLDNGTSGVLHTNTRCTNCAASPIFGLRWSCSSCHSVHLCSSCYTANAHDINHAFVRYVVEGDPGVTVGERAKEKLAETYGTYPGAMVERGPDWRFQNQDGGIGTRGVVRDIHGWEGGPGTHPTARSVVSVVWPNQEDNMYCRGHKGQVHIQCILPGRGGKVYHAHLPILGYKQEAPAKRFLIGQFVMVNVDVETLKQMQIGHGGFNPNMMEVVGKRGKVHRITEKGLIRVQYNGNPPLDHRWAINPAALRIVHGHSVGDKVSVTGDRVKVAKYQNPSALESVVGCSGVITLIHSEASYVIDFGEGKVMTIHPGCLEPPKEQDDRLTVNLRCVKAAVSGDQVAVESFLTGSYSKSDFVIIPDNTTITTSLHKAVGKGHLNVVVIILKYRSSLVNDKLEDKTVLQIAAHEGHSMIIDWLMQFGANPALGDQTGDQALHYSAIGGKTEAVLTLVNKGADVNCVNSNRRTALHIAVVNRNVELVSTLLKVGADVNIQDVNGDSPFHLALVHGDHTLIDLLIDGVSFLACNGRGHNSLHIAAVRGDVLALRKILKRDRTIINIVSRDGQPALHLASHSPAALLALTSCPQCDVNIADSKGRTALHEAASKLDVTMVQQLVEVGANVTSQDMLGNTPAHLALIEGKELGHYSNQMDGLLDKHVMDMLPTLGLSQLEKVQVGIVLYLFKQGAGDVANYHNQTVTELLENPEAKKFVQEISLRSLDCQSEHEYAEIAEVPEAGATAAAEVAGPPECLVCSEIVPLVTFLPCTHQVACMDCSLRVKKCLKCGTLVQEKKFDATGEEANKERERLKSLEMKVQDLEDQFLCSICMERRRNVAFLCGHGACEICTEGLDTCHMCRTVIERKIPLY